MKIENMTSSRGNTVANQFIIKETGNGANGNFVSRLTFQSYNSIIATWTVWEDGRNDIVLDKTYWNYSTTTGKYRNIFLGEDKKTTQKKIDSGQYQLTNLNN